MAKSYSEKLRDPRWQKKRLEILQRDNFTCQHCKDTETELHVHHNQYKGNPWDVPNETLNVLCKFCHTVEEEVKKAKFITSNHLGTAKLTHVGAPLIVRNYEDLGYVLFYFDLNDKYIGLEIYKIETINGLLEFHHNQLTHGEGTPVF